MIFANSQSLALAQATTLTKLFSKFKKFLETRRKLTRFLFLYHVIVNIKIKL